MTTINELLEEGLDTEAVELLVGRINEVGQILQLSLSFADALGEDDPDLTYFAGYNAAISDMGLFLLTGERPGDLG